MLDQLSDEILIESYNKALQLHLDSNFIFILEEELLFRGLRIEELTYELI